MKLNFQNINNLLAVLDALVDETCEAWSTDYFNNDRKKHRKAARRSVGLLCNSHSWF